MSESGVRIWEETVVIPTYGIGAPDRNPMFLEKRVYQGSSGAVYPYPVIDKIEDEKHDQEWKAVFIENEYLKIMALPQLGGRVQMALDKTNGYHFIYYNRVIKPALVGLAGPWISGGIEFNWPQHHRPNTYGPVSHRIAEEEDGGKTLWCGETDRMHGTRGLHGLTLRPGKAYLEVQGRVYNPTPLPQTFLWWANPAVAVNENYQSVFPPDVTAVMDHGKRDVSTFPVATGEYYKVDYSPGTDISWYKNLPVPTSYMAYKSDFDFVGGYDHGKRAGMLHVADHHVSPGKKQWTWGCGDFGRAWDRNLTDEDGPYFELMCGVYTDNQPDFSWLMPYEEKRFTQYFLPYKEIGQVKNANQDVAVNFEVAEGKIHVSVYVSAKRTITIDVSTIDESLLEETVELTPFAAWRRSMPAPENLDDGGADIWINEGERELLNLHIGEVEHHAVPEPAQPAPAPQNVETCEELLFWGTHLEQYRHATREPMDYYLEALQRDPTDMRNNTAMGKLLLRRGKFFEAEKHLQAAVEKSISRNPNPYDSEPYFFLGMSYMLHSPSHALGAEEYFGKAAWSDAWKESAWYHMAQLDCMICEYEDALKKLDDVLRRSGRHQSARVMKVAILCELKQFDRAQVEIDRALSDDPLNLMAMLAQHSLLRETASNDDVRAYLELLEKTVRPELDDFFCAAIEFYHSSFGDWAFETMRMAQQVLPELADANPMVHYYLAHFIADDSDEAKTLVKRELQLARECELGACFPNRLFDIRVLSDAIDENPEDASAHYLLGCLWYDKRQYEDAIGCWERARELRPGFPTARRNLGLAYVNKRGDLEGALREYEAAFELDTSDARVMFELDQLYKKIGRGPEERLAFLDRHAEQTAARDDLTIERIGCLNMLGRWAEALEILAARKFHPWEGGEGKVTGQYATALVESAKAAIGAGKFSRAVELLEQTVEYPHNLGEGKLHGAQENDIHYYWGKALEGLGRTEEAREMWERASRGLSEPASAMFYNDQPPEKIFYQGLALRRLGREAEAVERFRRLAAYGERHMEDPQEIDYFAVSLPDFLVFDEDLGLRNRQHCRFMIGLGRLGLGESEAAMETFDEVLRCDPNHQQARIHRAM